MLPSAGIARVEGSVGSLIDISLGIDPENTGRENVYMRGAFVRDEKSRYYQKNGQMIDFLIWVIFDMPVRTYSSGRTFAFSFCGIYYYAQKFC